MRLRFSVILPDGTEVERPPTEAEMQELAERYAAAVLRLSLPGAAVRVRRRESSTKTSEP